MSTLSKVQEIVADALYVEKDECVESAKLMSDLGAESIDFLDIIFRLEQEFGIKLPKGDIESKARGSLSEEEFAVNGVIQDIGLENLKRAMPEVNPNDIRTGFLQRDIPTLFTVGTFVRMVNEKLGDASQVVALKSSSPTPVAPSLSKTATRL
jgi:acyl carrier protein